MKSFLPALACFAAAAFSSAAAAQRICTLVPWLPSDYDVLQVGAREGSAPWTPEVELDDSGYVVKRADIVVSHPAKPVVLVMSALEPVVWNISWEQGTRIVGAFVSGEGGQAVLGLPRWIPLLVTSRKGRNQAKPSCPVIDVTVQPKTLKSELIEKIAGKSPQAFYPVSPKGPTWIGERKSGPSTPPLSSKDYTIAEFALQRAPGELPMGRRGIDVLVKQGAIRPATRKDVMEMEGLTAKAQALVRSVEGAESVYVPDNLMVILKPIKLPDGLYGAHSMTFIVARGAPFPSGPEGHNTFYVMDAGPKDRCRGVGCNR